MSSLEDIQQKDWGIKDIIEEKRNLLKINPEYLHALEKPDPNIFIKKHPDLF